MNACRFSFLLLLLAACHSEAPKPAAYGGWRTYGGSKDNIHYSALSQVDTSNVAQLEKVWEYHTLDGDSISQIQVNSIVIDSILYGVTPKLKLFALNAVTGEPKWVYDPAATAINACRGVAYYKSSDTDQRLFYTVGSFLYCVDAVKGVMIWKIDLHNDLGRDVKDLFVTSTTPGMVYKDMIIIGCRVAEEAAAAPGHIRAYDVHTGKLRWIFHTIPYPGEAGYESWKDTAAYKHIGGANSWSGFSLDEEKGVLFAPVGSASFDFYGGKRLGDGLFANCMLALDANTGRRIWHFQTVHHDIWDRDPPTPPVPVTVQKDGASVEAVVQTTKTGFIFLLDRKTGKPLYPVEERPVPTSGALPGEELSPTQPYSVGLPVFARQSLTEAGLNHLVPDTSVSEIERRLAGYKTGSLFTPPSKEGTVIFPGFDGAAEWGGPAFDPKTGLLYVNANEMPWILTMVDAAAAPKTDRSMTVGQAGKALYANNCMACHGEGRKGAGNYPSLIGVKKKYTTDQFMSLISSGRRMMPAFKQLSQGEKDALAAFILEQEAQQKKVFTAAPKVVDPYYQLPYGSTGYHKFLTKEGYPAVAPPWGTLTAIDLNKGVIVWKDTLGDYQEFKERGIHTGTENYGGPVVTAGGLVFIAATSDSKIRAFNKWTGRLLWEADLPACGFATPSVYEAGGRQFLVIACGGGKLKKKSGDSYVAFALGLKQ
ncbi:MAG: PQQ-binding-like beta-propeller repeat protein [Bacteroidetes bacterium]|nr:PQQ-binding-like beta-propeller repeat protein [Bacteroidota bacterium]